VLCDEGRLEVEGVGDAEVGVKSSVSAKMKIELSAPVLSHWSAAVSAGERRI
jgi:hypothetical protein